MKNGGIKMENADIVIPVKWGEHNEELRYCLRSIEKNLPHRNVVIAGYKPKWVKNVKFISVAMLEQNKYKRVANNILAAANFPELSDWFILFNDDMFVVEPVKSIQTVHRGKLDPMAHIYDSAPLQRKSMITTLEILIAAGIKDPMNYEVHSPMMINRHGLLNVEVILRTMSQKRAVWQLRSLYGNLHHIAGEVRHDVKIADNASFEYADDFPFISTTDQSFKHGEVGEVIRSRFIEKSKYER
jgi:hypothetical protein